MVEQVRDDGEDHPQVAAQCLVRDGCRQMCFSNPIAPEQGQPPLHPLGVFTGLQKGAADALYLWIEGRKGQIAKCVKVAEAQQFLPPMSLPLGQLACTREQYAEVWVA